MAGSHDVVIRTASGHCFLVKTRPARILTRIPYFGPHLTYDLGKPVRFRLAVRYLGLEKWAGDCDVGAKPVRLDWTEDIVLELESEPIGSGDDLKLDIEGTAFDQKPQVYLTKPFYLEGPGRAQLQIGPPYQAAYMFEVKEASGTVVRLVVPLATALIGFVLGFLLKAIGS